MVGIVILNYNNSEDTLNCVESVMQFNTYPIKIVVVDNGSSDRKVVEAIDSVLSEKYSDSYAVFHEGDDVPAKLERITFFISQRNDGYARGNNKGLSLLYKDAEVNEIMILNSDILFVEDIIGQLVADLHSAPNAAIISPLLYKKGFKGIDYNCARKSIPLTDLFLVYLFLFKDVFKILSSRTRKRNLLWGKELPLDEPLIEIELPSGSCMLCNKDFFRSIGSFDPNTFLYNEENILWEKIKRLGKKNYLDTRLKCIHLGATTIDNKTSSEFILNCSIESNHYFLKNYTDANKVYLFFMQFFYAMLRMKFKIRQKIR